MAVGETHLFLDGPALPRPYGIAPGPLDEGRHSIGYVFVIFPSILCTMAVAIRLASRLAIKRFAIEDALIICALGVFAGEEYALYKISKFPGLFIHQWDLQLKHLSRVQYYIHIGSIFYGLIVMCLRIAILRDWLRLFVPKGQRAWLFWTLHALIWANVIYYASGTFIEAFRCHPREKIWNPLYDGGSCPINFNATNLASAVINVVSDFAILVLPQWVIWNLHVSRSKRVAVSLLFAIGLFACICATVRLVYLVRMLRSHDTTYYVSYVSLWGIGEITIGFLIIGIPSIPKAVQILPFQDSIASIFGRFGSSNEKGTYEANRSWPRSVPRKRESQWEISVTDTFDLVTTVTLNTGDSIGAEPGRSRETTKSGPITHVQSY